MFFMDQFRRGKRSGFTLVELLVVIAIVSILAALLLPTLNRARDAAAAIRCSNNIKQFAVATSHYQGDNSGAFPISDGWPIHAPYSNTGIGWHYLLDGYLTKKLVATKWNFDLTKESPLWHCATDVADQLPWNRIPNISYFANDYVIRSVRKDASGNVVGVRSLSVMTDRRIRSASRTLLFGEATAISIRREQAACIPWSWAEGWDQEFLMKSHSCGSIRTPVGFSATLHAGQANYAGADGHVVRLRPASIQEDTNDGDAELYFIPPPITDRNY